MIGFLFRFLFVAGVQAELMAQARDQSFVNRVCHSPNAVSLLLEKILPMRSSLPGPQKFRYFVVVCELLSSHIERGDMSKEDLARCASCLESRLAKLASNPLVVTDIVEAFNGWSQSLSRYNAGVAQG